MSHEISSESTLPSDLTEWMHSNGYNLSTALCRCDRGDWAMLLLCGDPFRFARSPLLCKECARAIAGYEEACGEDDSIADAAEAAKTVYNGIAGEWKEDPFGDSRDESEYFGSLDEIGDEDAAAVRRFKAEWWGQWLTGWRSESLSHLACHLARLRYLVCRWQEFELLSQRDPEESASDIDDATAAQAAAVAYRRMAMESVVDATERIADVAAAKAVADSVLSAQSPPEWGPRAEVLRWPVYRSGFDAAMRACADWAKRAAG